MYIRLGKGGDQIVTPDNVDFKIGKALIKKEPEVGLFVSTGVMTQVALEACKILEKENIVCGVMHMHTIKPLDSDAIKKYFPKVKSIVTIEEHSLIGGLGSAILEFCNEELPHELYKVSRIGILINLLINMAVKKLYLITGTLIQMKHAIRCRKQ